MEKIVLDLSALCLESIKAPSHRATRVVGNVIAQSIPLDSAPGSGCHTDNFSCHPEETSCGQTCDGYTNTEDCNDTGIAACGTGLDECRLTHFAHC